MMEGNAAPVVEVVDVPVGDAWENHCKGALKKFLLNAVVIDNSPILSTHNEAPKVAEKADDPIGFSGSSDSDEASEPEEGLGSENVANGDDQDEDSSLDHDLNIQTMADAFADEGMACSFLLPQDETQDADIIKERALKMFIPADLVIIDWYLKDDNSNLTQEILCQALNNDKKENGRLRMLCVYTGQTEIGDISQTCYGITQGVGIEATLDTEKALIYGENFCLVVLNKKTTKAAQLPQAIIDNMADLADGILPSFVLCAVSAVRKNTHHLITRFSKDLDAAYVSNRLITDPPGDVAELMRNLFCSECDAALGLEKIADEYLEKVVIEKWLKNKGQPKIIKTYNDSSNKNDDGSPKNIEVNFDFLCSLLTKGFDPLKGILLDDNDTPRSFQESARKNVSIGLHDTLDDCKKIERKFARLVSLKREAFGSSKLLSEEDWHPSLTLGTILCKVNDGGPDEYFYCLTPACDTIRLNGEEGDFLFLRLDEDNKKPRIIIKNSEGKDLKLGSEFKASKVAMIKFSGNPELGRVISTKNDNDQFKFTSEGNDYLWLGEVRNDRAQNDLSEFTKKWMRFGIMDSEYLRLAGKESAKF